MSKIVNLWYVIVLVWERCVKGDTIISRRRQSDTDVHADTSSRRNDAVRKRWNKGSRR